MGSCLGYDSSCASMEDPVSTPALTPATSTSVVQATLAWALVVSPPRCAVIVSLHQKQAWSDRLDQMSAPQPALVVCQHVDGVLLDVSVPTQLTCTGPAAG